MSTNSPTDLATRATGALRLLDREPPADYLREWTERIAAEKKVADAGTTSALLFRIGVEWLALPTRIFQEVAEQCPVHSLPHRAGGIVAGIVNIRGELLVCASLGSLLGLEDVAEVKRKSGRRVFGRLLIANREGNRLAFPVDEVFGVHRYHPHELRPAPSTLAESNVTYTTGLLPWRDRTVGCIDDELLFYTLNKSLS
jgi:chemotaxis-related protein WspD